MYTHNNVLTNSLRTLHKICWYQMDLPCLFVYLALLFFFSSIFHPASSPHVVLSNAAFIKRFQSFLWWSSFVASIWSAYQCIIYQAIVWSYCLWQHCIYAVGIDANSSHEWILSVISNFSFTHHFYLLMIVLETLCQQDWIKTHKGGTEWEFKAYWNGLSEEEIKVCLTSSFFLCPWFIYIYLSCGIGNKQLWWRWASLLYVLDKVEW